MERAKLASTGSKARAAGNRGRGTAPGGAGTVGEALGSAPKRITLGDREYELRPLNFNDLVIAERDWNTVAELFERAQRGSLRAVRYLLWLMLRKSDPDLTEEGVGELIPMSGAAFQELAAQISGATGMQDETAGEGAGAGESPTGER